MNVQRRVSCTSTVQAPTCHPHKSCRLLPNRPLRPAPAASNAPNLTLNKPPRVRARSKAEHSGARVQLQMRTIPTGAAASNLRRNSAMRAGKRREAHCTAPTLRRYAATSGLWRSMANLRGVEPMLQRRAWVCKEQKASVHGDGNYRTCLLH